MSGGFFADEPDVATYDAGDRRAGAGSGLGRRIAEPRGLRPTASTSESAVNRLDDRAHRAASCNDDYDEEGEAALAEMQRETAGLPVRGAPPPTPMGEQARAARCVDCGEADGQQRFFEAFGISVCYDCQRACKGQGGKYQVITKSKAKDEYLLTDRQLDQQYGGLGCLVQPNPHDSRFGDMKLYLRSQAEQLALQVWGSDEGLFDEKERRAEERQRKAAARKRKSEAGGGTSSTLTIGGSKKRPIAGAARGATSTTSVPRMATAPHRHVFLPDETYDEATDTWTKRCACGFEVTYERM